MKFLFLYTEIAEYFLACCHELTKHGEVHIVRWAVNKEAPFKFQFNEHIKIYNKENYNIKELQELVKTINPSIIICSGWIDRDYLKITKTYYGKIPTVMTCDTHWTGSLKQQIARVLSRFTLLKTFSHAWVPGQSQKQYALRLGFKVGKILTGFYSCDLMRFESIYQNQFQQKQKQFPKRFLFVGRYVELKGIKELWKAFIDLNDEQPNDWELWCLGVGDITPIKHPKIKHFGFVQPSDLSSYAKQTGVFVLPSRFEPWGVVVHEYAASGFPLLLSNQVGAKEQFLHVDKNGFEFEAGNMESIKLALKKVMALKDIQLLDMGATSNKLSKSISPKTWVDSLLRIL